MDEAPFEDESAPLVASDRATFVTPHAAVVEAARAYLMAPPNDLERKFGYDPRVGLIRGGWYQGGWHDAFVLVNTNLILARTLDHLNAAAGQRTRIEANLRGLLAKPFVHPTRAGTFRYDGSDRREIMYGKAVPCVRPSSDEVSIGSAQEYYLRGHAPGDGRDEMVAALPSTDCYPDLQPGQTRPMNVYALFVEYHHRAGRRELAKKLFEATLKDWTSAPGWGVKGSVGGYFSDAFDNAGEQGDGKKSCRSTRSLAYWLHAARVTGYWRLSNQARRVAQQVVQQVLAARHPDGGFGASYPGCMGQDYDPGYRPSRVTGESTGLVLLALTPVLE
jgi:hypothetical protein